MSQKKPSVLVTGAAGYVGRLTIETLHARRDDLGTIVALDVREMPRDARHEGVVYAVDDICSENLPDLMRTHHIDTIVHLASILRTPKGSAPDFAYHVDVDGTKNVLEAAKAAGASKLIVTTSGAAYGYYADNPRWIDEEDAIRGNDDFEYARNKKLIEALLKRWRDDFPEIKQLIFRPSTVVGESVKSPVTDLFEKRVMLGIVGSESRFVFIWDRDLVACFVEGIFSDKTGIYNVAGDGAMTAREIAQKLDKPYLPLPASLVKVALWTAHTLRLSEHGPKHVKFLRYRPVLSNRRLKDAFGFIPKLSSEEAFEFYAKAKGLIN
ncbi:MAG: NAD-dependent epimerase/dehydratase family protein [Deltaproteobacteria bacterium]|nr:NAD-dependent epimerase/dehydratase family protein [Deltaproteobacteria bacterium]